MNLLKLQLTFILLISAIIFISCDLLNPKEEEPDPEPEPSTEVTIGSEGGELKTDDFTLTVPSGAFTSNTSLNLYEEPDTNNFAYGLSKVYRISGIQQDFKMPLKVKIKYSGELSDQSYIIFDRMKNVESIDTSYLAMGSDSYKAEDSSGYLIAYIKPNAETGGLFKINSEIDNVLRAAAGHTKSSEHFTIIHSDYDFNEQSVQFDNLLSYYEEAYNRYLGLGFDYSSLRNPIKLKVYYKWFPRIESDKNGITVYTTKLFPFNEYNLRLFLEHSFLNVYYFDFNKPKFWGSWAVAGWSTKINNLIDFKKYHYRIESNISQIFNGFRHTGNHKFRLLPLVYFLEYISTEYSNSLIATIVNNANDEDNPLYSIVLNTDENILPKYYNHIVSNNNYEGLVDGYFISDEIIEDTVTINSTFSNESITDIFNDFSGKLYKVELANDVPEDQNLIIESGADNFEHVHISVFSYQGNNIEFLGDAESEIEIENIKSYADEGKGFLILITNNQVHEDTDNHQTEITTDFNFNDNRIPEYSRIYFEIKNVKILTQIIHPDGTSRIDTSTVIGNAEGYLFNMTSFTIWENSYEAVWDMEIPNAWSPVYYATLNVDFSSDRSMINKLTYKGERSEPDGSSTSKKEVVIENIPLKSNNKYKLGKDENVCASITNIAKEGKVIWRDGTQTTSKVIGWSCTEESYIEITFYK